MCDDILTPPKPPMVLPKHLVDQTHEDDFEKNLNVIREYIYRYDRLPNHLTEFKKIKLGLWMTAQIGLYHRKLLPQGKIQQLEQVPRWSWSKKLCVGHTPINLLRDYVRLNGFLPDRKVVFRGFALGKWQAKQHEMYQRRSLSSESIRELESIDGWEWGQLRIRFRRNIKLLREYVEKYASLPRSSDTYKGVKLGGWIAYQRQKYRAKSLSKEAIVALEKIEGWEWGSEPEVNFAQKVRLAADYIKEFGVLPEKSVVYQAFPLGVWFQNERNIYRDGFMNKLRSKAMEKLFALSNESKRVCENCGFTDLLKHSCIHVNNFKVAKEMDNQSLCLRITECWENCDHLGFIFYAYWYRHKNNGTQASPFPMNEYIRDVVLKFHNDLIPLRWALHNASWVKTIINEKEDETEKVDLLNSYDKFKKTFKAAFNCLCLKNFIPES